MKQQSGWYYFMVVRKSKQRQDGKDGKKRGECVVAQTGKRGPFFVLCVALVLPFVPFVLHLSSIVLLTPAYCCCRLVGWLAVEKEASRPVVILLHDAFSVVCIS